jgi:hypothetical protein
MNIELNNPSPWHQLRVASQTRARNVVDAAAPAPAPKAAPTRAELEKIGSELVMVPSKGTVREADGMLRSVTRNCPTPFYKTAGFDTLPEFITENLEKGTRESQQALAPAPRGERVVDKWLAPTPLLSVPPGGKALVNVEEHQRLTITCEEPVTLQLSNTSNSHTLRLRTLDTASGESAHVSFIPPTKDWPSAAIVSANGKSAAVVELMPR